MPRGLGDRADGQRHLALALGDTDRRRAAGARPFQRHGVVGGVDDHHVGLGHVEQHAVGGDRLGAAAPLRLHVRVALGLLVLLAEVLEGHPQPPGVVEALPDQVDAGDGDGDDGGDGQQHDQRLQHQASHHLSLGGGGADHPVEVAAEVDEERHRHGGELDGGLGELDQAGGAELALGVAEERDPRELGLDLVAGEGDGLLGEEADQHGADRHQEDRRQGRERLGQDRPGEARAAGAEDAAGEAVRLRDEDHQHRGGLLQGEGAGGGDDGEERNVGGGGGDVGGARDVALAPGLGELVRRRVEDLFAAAVVALAHLGRPKGSASVRSKRWPQKCSSTGAASIRIRRPPAVIAGAPMKATMSCGMARLMAPSARL